MVEFNAEQMSERELVEAANRIFAAQEADFEKLKSEKWYQTLFHAITLNQDGKKYAVRGINSLTKLQQLFMGIYVKNYKKTHEQLDAVIETVIKNSEAIKKLYGMCVLNLKKQERLEMIDSQDAEILAIFLGEYRDENGSVPSAVCDYNRGVLRALNQEVPYGTLDNHQIRRLKAPEVVYRCFMEQCAVDGTIDTQEWTDKIYEDLKDFELSENSKNEIKESVKKEAEIAGKEYFIVKYSKNNAGVSDIDFEIDIDASINPAEAEKKEAQGELKQKARLFYQKPILLVYSPTDEDVAEYFKVVLDTNREKLGDYRLASVTKIELKEYIKRSSEYEKEGTHIIMIGDSQEAKKGYKVYLKMKEKRWDYYNLGMRYITGGNKTILLVRPLKDEQIDDLVHLAASIKERQPMIIPEGIKSVYYTVLKDCYQKKGLFEKQEEVLTDILAVMETLPLAVLAQAKEIVENGVQWRKNLGASKDLKFLQYCVAIYKYLESENAIVD